MVLCPGRTPLVSKRRQPENDFKMFYGLQYAHRNNFKQTSKPTLWANIGHKKKVTIKVFIVKPEIA